MSHFSVAVLTDSLGKIDMHMAPYQENNMGDCPREYMEFFNVEDERLQEYENEGVERVLTPDGDYLTPYDDQFRKEGTIGYGGADTHEIPNRFKKVTVPFKELYPTFEEFMADYYGVSERDPEFGVFGYWENPEARWDWYEIGGRWANMLLVKDSVTDVIYGEHYREPVKADFTPKNYKWVDGARLKDIEFEKMADFGVERAEERWKEAEFEIHKIRQEKDETAEINDGRFFFQYGIHKGQTKESYIKRAEFGTFAFLNGVTEEWCEKGKMGWWATSSETEEEAEQWDLTYFDNFIKNADQELYLVIVDCHI